MKNLFAFIRSMFYAQFETFLSRVPLAKQGREWHELNEKVVEKVVEKAR